MAVKRRRGRREPPPRTPQFRAFEAIGLAIGRTCMRSSELYLALTAGFTRAVRERAVGRKCSDADVESALADVQKAITEMRAPRPRGSR